MKIKTLFNSSSLDINNYPIEEAAEDQSGNVLWDELNHTYKKSGTTLEWSIKAGETLSFPYYVADYLQSIYPFLKHVNDKKSTGNARSNKDKFIDPASIDPAGLEGYGEDSIRE